MARKKSSVFEDLMEIGMKLPWQVCVALALIAYLGFHYLATMPPAPTVITDSKQMGQAISDERGQHEFPFATMRTTQLGRLLGGEPEASAG